MNKDSEAKDIMDNGQQEPVRTTTTDGVSDAAAPELGMPSVDFNIETEFEDHFSLRSPSSTVRFRGARVMVYEQANDQILLEDRVDASKKHTITVKRMRSGNFGLRFLRTTYTLVALLLTGFLFVFCFQIILFLFLDLPVNSGATHSSPLDTSQLIGTILSIPLFLHAMGSTMAMGTAFVTDTWNGHRLFQSILDWPIVAVEWVCFVIFLAIPVFTMCVTLFLGRENWWEISALTWMLCVFCYFIVFCSVIVFCELRGCFDLVQIHNNFLVQNENVTGWKRMLMLTTEAILLTQTQRYSGFREERYIVKEDDDTAGNGFILSEKHTPAETRMSLYSKMTLLKCFGYSFFETLDPPIRRYNLEEMRDIVPFVTNQNWSLEKMYCRRGNARVVYAVRGPSSLLPSQIWSSLVCTVVGVILASLLVTGFLVWTSKPSLSVLLVAMLILLCCVFPVAKSGMEMVRTYNTMHYTSDIEEAEEDSKDTTLYQIWESVTISRPKRWYCWTRFTFEVIFLFIWPIAALYKNPRVGTLFLILGFFSFLRIYFDAAWVLSELGSVNNIDLTSARGALSTPGMWNNLKTKVGLNSIQTLTEANRALLLKARTSEVIGKISRSRAVGRWMWVYGCFAVVALVMLLQAADADVTIPTGGRPPIVLLDDFYYPPQPDLAYPTCEMTKGFTIPGVGSSSLGDYAFLAALSYETQNITQFHLDQWFGEGAAIDESEFVEQYRIDSNTVNHPVYYKLISFPSIPGYGIVSIRGSQTVADFIVDAQLWSAAFLAQVVRAFIPFGWIWTPILDDLVTAVNFVESNALKKVSYYKLTSDFVNAVLEDGYAVNGKSFSTLRITGASLGGGLAIITGAQTRANAVAISGLNAQLSRHTFDPPLTMEQLNTRVFNVIPDRDMIARVGDRSRLFQGIDCKAPMSSLVGCHSMWRSICELSFTCGSGSRPVFCRCVEQFGYDKPIQNGTRTFEEACAEEEILLKNAGLE